MSYDDTEHIKPDSLRGVGRAGQVRHVDSLQQLCLGRVSVQMELQFGRVTERDQSNPADSWTVRGAVDVHSLDDHADELSHVLEVVERHAVGRIEREHHVSAVRTRYTCNLQRLLAAYIFDADPVSDHVCDKFMRVFDRLETSSRLFWVESS